MIFIGILNGVILLHFFVKTISFPRYVPKINKIMEKDVFIENLEYPSCTSCKFYEPKGYYFEETISRCNKFGRKDIITSEIDFLNADICRLNEDKCGKKGRFYIEEPNLLWKKWKFQLTRYTTIVLSLYLFLLFAYLIDYLKYT